jgi:hypothetical protein
LFDGAHHEEAGGPADGSRFRTEGCAGPTWAIGDIAGSASAGVDLVSGHHELSQRLSPRKGWPNERHSPRLFARFREGRTVQLGGWCGCWGNVSQFISE